MPFIVDINIEHEDNNFTVESYHFDSEQHLNEELHVVLYDVVKDYFENEGILNAFYCLFEVDSFKQKTTSANTVFYGLYELNNLCELIEESENNNA